MKRAIDILTILFIIVILAAILLHFGQSQPLQRERMSLSDENYLLNALQVRGADDCKVTPIEGGWRCVEFGTGRIFIVRRPM